MIKTVRRSTRVEPGTRVDPTVVRPPVKPRLGACLACASGGRGQHTCAG